MEVPSQSSKHSRHKNVEDYSNLQELISDVAAFRSENFILAQKVELLERYLKKKCPLLLIGVEKLEANLRNTVVSLNSLRSSTVSAISGHSPFPSPSSSRHGGRASHSYPHNSATIYRICPLFKIDIVDRELDESKISMDKLQRRFESAMFLLKTEEENLKSDIALVEEFKTALENFVKQNTDKKTGRVFHDKFLRLVESELQNCDRDLRKMQLKTKSLQIDYNRLIARQGQRLELRERLHPVDMNKLIIENEELHERLEQKTKVTMELKKTVGKKGQYLVLMKSKLNDTLLSLRSIRQDIKQKETKYKFTEEKEVKNVNELITAEIINQNMKKLSSSFKSPDAHTYLMVQVRLTEIKAEKEMWERRFQYQRQSILLLEHQLKQLSPPIQKKSKGLSTPSLRTSRTPYSSKSADSMFRHFSSTLHHIPHCTPTSPPMRRW